MSDLIEKMIQDVLGRLATLGSLSEQFDVIVAGAGPAGSLAAYLSARAGHRVLLVEKQHLPRYKVCGCCLSARALSCLQKASLEGLIDGLGKPLSEIELFWSNGRAILPLTESKVLSREVFDLALVDAAIKAGATVVSGISAQLTSEQTGDIVDVCLDDGSANRTVNGKVIVVADGLKGDVLQSMPGMTPEVDPRSRVGIGAVSSEVGLGYEDGTVYMGYTAAGYVGLVRLEDGRIDIAASVDVRFLQTHRGAAAAAVSLLKECKLAIPADIHNLNWKGTAPLTRKRMRMAAHRVFVIGDSASYVEPFTGEGIAWALTGAEALAPLVDSAVSGWDPALVEVWTKRYREMVTVKQGRTRRLVAILRNYRATSVIAKTLAAFPALAPTLINMMVD